MAENLDIVISERGAREVQRSILGIGTAAKTASGPLNNLQRLLGAYASLEGLRRLGKLADQFTEMENRIKVLDGVSDSYSNTLRRIFDVSQETRSSLKDNVLLFQRMGLAQRDLGATSEQLFQITRAVGQAIAIQGGLATTSAGAVLQLSQAFGSGRVQLEEFNSVITGLYPVAKAAADGIDGTGGSIGRLRDMIKKGEVDSRLLFQGILKSVTSLDEQFGKTTPTISQAFTILHNALLMTAGDFNTASGASQGFAKWVITLSNNLDTLILSASVLVSAGLPLLFAKITIEVLKLAKAITALMFTNPFTAIASLASGALGYFILFNSELDKIDKKTGKYISAVDRLGAAWAGTLAYVKAAWANFPEWFGEIIDSAVTIAISKLSKLGSSVAGGLGLEENSYLSNMLKSLDFVVPPDAKKRLETNGKDAAKAFYTAYDKFLKDALAHREAIGKDQEGLPALPGISGKEDKTLKNLDRELRSLISSIDPVAGAWLEWGKAQQTVEKSLDAGLITLDEYNQLLGQAYRHFEASLSPLGDFNKEMDRQVALLNLEVDARERLTQIYSIEDHLGRQLTDAEKDAVETKLKRVQLLSTEREILDELIEPTRQYMQHVEALNALLKEGSISSEQYANKARDLRIAFLESATDIDSKVELGFLKAGKSAMDVSSAIEQGFSNAFSNIEDALLNLAQTGKINFNDLANSMLSNLMRVYIRMLIMQPLINSFGSISGIGGGGGFLGGLFGGGSGLPATASWALPGMASGGFTGVGNRYEAAGLVHKNEYVLNQDAVQRIGVGNLDRINNGGSMNSDRPTVINMNIYTPDANSFHKSQSQIMRQYGQSITRELSRT